MRGATIRIDGNGRSRRSRRHGAGREFHEVRPQFERLARPVGVRGQSSMSSRIFKGVASISGQETIPVLQPKFRIGGSEEHWQRTRPQASRPFYAGHRQLVSRMRCSVFRPGYHDHASGFPRLGNQLRHIKGAHGVQNQQRRWYLTKLQDCLRAPRIARQ